MKTLIILSSFICLSFSNLVLADETHKMQTLNLKIEGMTCGICSAKVKKSLTGLCKEATIDWKKGEGVCTCEGACDKEKILSESNKTGFKTTLKN